MQYIIDTDIGDDIDDALAIAYAVDSGLDVIGITTVCRNTLLRAKTAAALCRSLGASIPTYVGLVNGPVTKYDEHELFCQYDRALDGVAQATEPTAVDFLVDSARRLRENLTVVAIGPLTNLAAAFEKDEQAFEKSNIVIMGGDFTRRVAESNIFTDPESAHRVATSQIACKWVGVDLTQRVQLDEKQYAAMLAAFDGKGRKKLNALITAWRENTGRLPCLHDVLTVYAAVEGTAFAWKTARFNVELVGKYTRGYTVLQSEVCGFGAYRYADGAVEAVQKERAVFAGAEQRIATDCDTDVWLKNYMLSL